VGTTLLIHVAAGALGLLSGYVALYVSKGRAAHRRSGILFVYVMMTMAATGVVISATQGVAPAINVPSGLLVVYLVITSLMTVRPHTGKGRWIEAASAPMAFGIAFVCGALAVLSLSKGGGEAGLAYPLLLFGGVASAAGVGDLRARKRGPLQGAARLKRHLWRMCFGLFIASIAFYLGPDRLPASLRSPAFRAAGVLTPIAAMGYWLWRLRNRRRFLEFSSMDTRAPAHAPAPQ
jgi:uncharacterized membrane protein